MKKPVIQEFSHRYLSAVQTAARNPRHPEARLMVVLHGRGDDLRSFTNIPEEFQIPTMNYLLLNGVHRYDTGYRWCEMQPGDGLLRVRARLGRMMKELEALGWSSRQIFFYGFSEGCLAGSDFVLHYHKPLAGFIGISGCVHFFSGWRRRMGIAARNTPFLFTHGLNDDVIPLADTLMQVGRLQEAGVPVHFEVYNKKHEIEYRKEVPFLRQWVRGLLRPTKPRITHVGILQPVAVPAFEPT